MTLDYTLLIPVLQRIMSAGIFPAGLTGSGIVKLLH